jgi:predicted nucleotidyltransferase
MTVTLTRPKPRIDHPEELERMVRQIVERVDPVAIYLFGSRARGDAREDSDYDLLIVVPDDFPYERTTPSCAFALIEDRKIPMDAALVPENRFEKRSKQVGTLSYEVASDGLRIYGRRPER